MPFFPSRVPFNTLLILRFLFRRIISIRVRTFLFVRFSTYLCIGIRPLPEGLYYCVKPFSLYTQLFLFRSYIWKKVYKLKKKKRQEGTFSENCLNGDFF